MQSTISRLPLHTKVWRALGVARERMRTFSKVFSSFFSFVFPRFVSAENWMPGRNISPIYTNKRSWNFLRGKYGRSQTKFIRSGNFHIDQQVAVRSRRGIVKRFFEIPNRAGFWTTPNNECSSWSFCSLCHCCRGFGWCTRRWRCPDAIFSWTDQWPCRRFCASGRRWSTKSVFRPSNPNWASLR